MSAVRINTENMTANKILDIIANLNLNFGFSLRLIHTGKGEDAIKPNQMIWLMKHTVAPKQIKNVMEKIKLPRDRWKIDRKWAKPKIQKS